MLKRIPLIMVLLGLLGGVTACGNQEENTAEPSSSGTEVVQTEHEGEVPHDNGEVERRPGFPPPGGTDPVTVDDEQQIRELIENKMVRNNRSASQYYTDIINNTCTELIPEDKRGALLEQYGNENDPELEQNLESMPSSVGIESIDISGDTAVATVVIEYNGETQRSESTLKREDGQWKFC